MTRPSAAALQRTAPAPLESPAAGLDLRVAAPVNVRRDEHAGQLGNRVSTWVVRLPLDEADPVARVERIRELTGVPKREGRRAASIC